MLKWLKRLLFGVLCLALLGGAIYAGGLLLPADTEMEGVISVNAEAEHVHRLFNSAEGLSSWLVPSAQKSFADLVATHTGPEAGPGMKLSFEAGGKSMGTQTVRESTATSVVYDVDYGSFALTRTISLDGVGPLTTVTWTETAVLEDPLFRYFALFSEKTVEGEIAGALEDLRAAVEPIAIAARAAAAKTAAEAKRIAAEEAARVEAEAAAVKEKQDAEWEYTQEEAPTPIDITQLPAKGAD